MTRTIPKWLIPSVLIIVTGVIVYFGFRGNSDWKKDHVLVQLKPIQVSNGWGYDILTDGKVFIHQNVIPAVGGNRIFRTKEDALAVGQKVCDRLVKGDVPMVTAKEVRDMGVAEGIPMKSR